MVRVVLPRDSPKTDLIPELQSVEHQPRVESCRSVVVSPSGATAGGVSCEVCTKLPSNLEGLAERIETLEASDAVHEAKMEDLKNENSKLWEKVPTTNCSCERLFISSNLSDLRAPLTKLTANNVSSRSVLVGRSSLLVFPGGASCYLFTIPSVLRDTLLFCSSFCRICMFYVCISVQYL